MAARQLPIPAPPVITPSRGTARTSVAFSPCAMAAPARRGPTLSGERRVRPMTPRPNGANFGKYIGIPRRPPPTDFQLSHNLTLQPLNYENPHSPLPKEI